MKNSIKLCMIIVAVIIVSGCIGSDDVSQVVSNASTIINNFTNTTMNGSAFNLTYQNTTDTFDFYNSTQGFPNLTASNAVPKANMTTCLPNQFSHWNGLNSLCDYVPDDDSNYATLSDLSTGLSTKINEPLSGNCLAGQFYSATGDGNNTCTFFTPAGSALSYYLHGYITPDTPDAPFPSYIANRTLNVSYPKFTITSTAVQNGNTSIANWTTDGIGVLILPAGIHQVFIDAERVGGSVNRIDKIYYDCYTVNSTGGNVTFMGTSDFSRVLPSVGEVPLILNLPMGDMITNTSDRMLVAINVNQTGTGVKPDVLISVDDATASRLVLPTVQQDLSPILNNKLNKTSDNVSDTHYNLSSPSGNQRLVITDGQSSCLINSVSGSSSTICANTSAEGQFSNGAVITAWSAEALGFFISFVDISNFNQFIVDDSGIRTYINGVVLNMTQDKTYLHTPLDMMGNNITNSSSVWNVSRIVAGTGINTTNDGLNVTVNSEVGAGTGVFYLWNATRNPSIHVMNQTLPSQDVTTVKTNTSTGLSSGISLITEWETDPLGITGMPAGVSHVHVHANQTVTLGAKSTKLYFALYTNDTVNNVQEFDGQSSETLTLTTASTEYDMQANEGGHSHNLTDTHLIKVYADVTGSGTAPEVKMQIEGNTLSRLELPFFTPVSANFIPYTGWLNDANGTTHNITINSITTSGINKGTYPNNTMFDYFESNKVNKSNAAELSGGTLNDSRLNTSVILNYTTNTKVGTFTITLSDATGTFPVTTVGFKPSSVDFKALINAGKFYSDGFDTVTNKGAIFRDNPITDPDTQQVTTGSSIVIRTTSTPDQKTCSVQSFDTDGMTISCIKTNSPTGIVTVLYKAQRI